MSKVIWVHDDALRHWWVQSPAVYVFDDDKLRREGWSLKRIGFVYECLLELPLEIRRGDPVTQVREFQQAHGAEGIQTMDSPDPRLRQQMAEMGAEIVADEPFVVLTGKLDLRRFSRYWAKAERALLPADNLKR
jgi:hypothetical protein